MLIDQMGWSTKWGATKKGQKKSTKWGATKWGSTKLGRIVVPLCYTHRSLIIKYVTFIQKKLEHV